MDTATISTEQFVTFNWRAVDGRKRTVAIQGDPVIALSDDTRATATIVAGTESNTWVGTVTPIRETDPDVPLDVTVHGDADPTDGVLDVVAIGHVIITLDPRTSERTAEINFDAPQDRPV